jgi:FkbM family methyltransferase
MGKFKKSVFRFARRLGYTVIPNWRLFSYPQASYVARLLEYARIDLVIDVGANAGQYRTFLREQAGYSGRIVSFEPIPRRVEEMRRIVDANWRIESAAVGAAEGEAEFNIMASDEFSSLLAPNHSKTKLFEAMNVVAECIKVPVRTLNAVADELDWLRQAQSIYLKLDTQGFDLEVLKGARTLLSRVAAIQCEHSVRGIYEGAPSFEESFRFIESLGFIPSGIYPNNAGHFPMLVEFDGHFIAERLLPDSHRPRS